MEQALRRILAAFSGKRVLVAGDVMLDEYIWGDAWRISPEAPVPVVEVRQRTVLPGGAANAAANVASLGGRTLLLGVIGADWRGEKLRETLAQRGVAADGLVIDSARVTTTKTRIMAHGKHVVRFDEEQKTELAIPLEDELLAWAAKQVPTVDACVLSDYSKGVVSSRFAERFLEMARQAAKPAIVDPKGADFCKFRGATLVKPNLAEARRSCRLDSDSTVPLLEIGRILVERLEGSAVLITCGREGMSLFRGGQSPITIPSVARTVFDVTGAGDTVTGTLALALAAGATAEQAAYLANRAAGIVVGKVGTAAVTQEELLADLA